MLRRHGARRINFFLHVAGGTRAKYNAYDRQRNDSISYITAWKFEASREMFFLSESMARKKAHDIVKVWP
jgi:hypothetical protein